MQGAAGRCGSPCPRRMHAQQLMLRAPGARGVRSSLKLDVDTISDASAFLREVGELYALFDLAVHRHYMYKVGAAPPPPALRRRGSLRYAGRGTGCIRVRER